MKQHEASTALGFIEEGGGRKDQRVKKVAMTLTLSGDRNARPSS
jgi:hypothetical protein